MLAALPHCVTPGLGLCLNERVSLFTGLVNEFIYGMCALLCCLGIVLCL